MARVKLVTFVGEFYQQQTILPVAASEKSILSLIDVTGLQLLMIAMSRHVKVQRFPVDNTLPKFEITFIQMNNS